MHNDEFEERTHTEAPHHEAPQFDLARAQELLEKIDKFQRAQSVISGSTIMNSAIERARPIAKKIVEKNQKKNKTVAAYNEEQLKAFHETVLSQVALDELMGISRRATNYTVSDWQFWANWVGAGAGFAAGFMVAGGAIKVGGSVYRKYVGRSETTVGDSPFTATARPSRRTTTHETVTAI